MSETTLGILRAWLLGNESQIAKGDEGKGMLQLVFVDVIGREAKG